MKKRRQCDERYVEELVYLALRILYKEGDGQPMGKLMDTLKQRGEVDDLQERLKGKKNGWRARFDNTASIFVSGGYLLRGRKKGWILTPKGKKEIEADDSETVIYKSWYAFHNPPSKA